MSHSWVSHTTYSICKFIHIKLFIFKKGPYSQQIDFTRVEPHHKLYIYES